MLGSTVNIKLFGSTFEKAKQDFMERSWSLHHSRYKDIHRPPATHKGGGNMSVSLNPNTTSE